MGRQELLVEATALPYIMIELQKQAGSISEIPRLSLHCVPRVHKCIAVIQTVVEKVIHPLESYRPCIYVAFRHNNIT